jgi:hypothetical protein
MCFLIKQFEFKNYFNNKKIGPKKSLTKKKFNFFLEIKKNLEIFLSIKKMFFWGYQCSAANLGVCLQKIGGSRPAG